MGFPARSCQCEHWQSCPKCMPHLFDSNGNRLPLPISDKQRIADLDAEAQALQNAVLVAAKTIEDQSARIDELERLLADTHITLNHASIFIATREKMHVTGQELYGRLCADIAAALKGGE